MKPFLILEERDRGKEIKEFLISTEPMTGKKVPSYTFEVGMKDYYFGYDGKHYVAGFSKEFLNIPKYRLDDFKYLISLEKILK